jgi:hypothetical protein
MSTPGQSRHLAVGRSLPVYTQLRICRRAAITDAKCHVWTAPSWQGLFSRLQRWSVQPCVRPFNAVHMTAGHNALRGSGSGQNRAFDNAMAQVGCPDRRIDRLCITCCSPSQPSHHAGCPARSRLPRKCDGLLVALALGHHGPDHCSTRRRVVPCFRSFRKYSNISSTSRGMMPSEGSSSITMAGSAAIARAIASICCSPPDKVTASCERRCLRRGKVSAMRSMIARSSPLELEATRPRRRFSSTESPGTMLRCSGT